MRWAGGHELCWEPCHRMWAFVEDRLEGRLAFLLADHQHLAEVLLPAVVPVVVLLLVAFLVVLGLEAPRSSLMSHQEVRREVHREAHLEAHQESLVLDAMHHHWPRQP